MIDRAKTAKKSKAVYIIGSITIGIIALLAVYFILIATGVISAEPVRIRIESASSIAEYDGRELKNDGWKLASGELKEGHELRVSVSGGQTEVGTSDNIFTAVVYDGNGYDVTDSYAIEYVPGVLEITPRKIIVQSASAEKDYDGTPLTANSCSIASGHLVDGHEIEYTVNGTLTSAGKADNTFTASVTDGVRDVTANYIIDKLYGTLYVHGTVVQISTASRSKVYDGTPLVCDEYTVLNDVLADDERAVVVVTGEQSGIGSSDNYATCEIVATDGTNRTSRYEIDFVFGTLEILPIVITVETGSATKVYDGTPLEVDRWRVVTDSTLATDEWLHSGDYFTLGEYRITATVVGSQTDVGIADNTAVYVEVLSGSEAAEGVSVEFKLGALVVMPRTLTIRTGSADKDFDGTPLTCNEWEIVSITQPADGDEVRVAVSGTLTYVGQTNNTVAEVLITNADGVDVTRNYNIKIQEGVLAVFGESAPPTANPNLVIMRVFSEQSTVVYLRQVSYGDYVGTVNWTPAAEYDGVLRYNGTDYGANYLPDIVMQNSGLPAMQTRIERVRSGYVVPYYPTFAEVNRAHTGDVGYGSEDTEYTYEHYNYAYTSDNGGALGVKDLGEYAEFERSYRSYVYDNYTAVPRATATFMQSVIDARGFVKDDPSVIAKIAEFVQNAAVYDKAYDRDMNNEPDIAVAFLRDYKRGICVHYATAATLLYRTLGIPARYTVGIMTPTTAGEWVDVSEGHAWVEVYIDGLGWMYVEVTGSSGDLNGDPIDPIPPTDGIGDPNSDKVLKIKPFDIYLQYREFDGTPLTYDLNNLQGLSELEKQGYTYTFTVEGEQSELGIGASTVTAFVLYDGTGADVTAEYNIKLSTGKLHIYMEELTVTTQSLERIYDGTPLRSEEGEGWECRGTFLQGHTESVVMTGEQTSVGRSINTFDIVMTDADGADVTYMYKINEVFGTLRVTPRTIVVTAGSAVGYTDEIDEDNPLTCADYTVSSDDGDGLGEGDTAAVVTVGSQSAVGRSANVIDSITITDETGKDVTSNYIIRLVDGTLTVLPAAYRPARVGEGG